MSALVNSDALRCQQQQDAGDIETSVCYICLQEGTDARPLVTPCACTNRPVHTRCMARWQLHSSGKSEEKTCRFCNHELPDWKPTLLGEDDEDGAPKPLLAAVVYNNVVYKIPILPGPEGKAAFKRQVNQLFGLSNRMFEVAFEVKVAEDKVQLSGLSAYEAATRCAARSARQQQQQQRAAAGSSSSAEGADEPPLSNVAQSVPVAPVSDVL
ncbi:hypothetical protein HYH03_012324 [Edaphochlamys debaryana]|uniref:RING-CH-type domain-containing protein n=1 Tax=Edaphochlamys debaryana TaxID=47281 RepID=A0A835XU69_9CHLO|nr:hypothetical protein HYH03_012324 [Edaphochlamys debaryana]|eukprot:KAG2489098.1 hypothetical protein HYH03_012324 [Edaphochlamys debaryana]